MLTGLLAIVIASAFASAALYINLAEHPARMQLPLGAAVAQWRPSYRRGFAMQASLAILGGGLALFQWANGSSLAWLAGGLLLLANWPYTLVVIMPVNRRLEAAGSENDLESMDLLRRWGLLHGVRTMLGIAATLFMIAGFDAQF